MQPGHAERRTHDYVRHGTTTLFAALEVATGQVTGLCKPRHRHQEFLIFLRHLARGYPDRELHLIMDNYGAHKHPKVKAWRAANPRIHIHFTPTSRSWLNLVEVWFGIIERQAIHRGNFRRSLRCRPSAPGRFSGNIAEQSELVVPEAGLPASSASWASSIVIAGVADLYFERFVSGDLLVPAKVSCGLLPCHLVGQLNRHDVLWQRVLDLVDLVNRVAIYEELILMEHAGRGGSHRSLSAMTHADVLNA
jgi:transposase